MVETKTLLTAEDLWQMGEEGRYYELVRGELIEMTPPGSLHGKIALRLGRYLQAHVEAHRLGEVMVESGYWLERDPDTVRGPDVSFTAASRVPPEGLPEGFFLGPPDLAVEVVSPGDSDAEVQDKVMNYLASGTCLVWVVRPRQRTVTVYHPDGYARVLRETETLEGEEVVPGFALPLRELFA